MIRLLAGLVLLGACGVDRQDESTSPDEMSLGEAGFVPGPWAARRLTRDQFVYLVEDVLDVRLSQAEQDALPQEVPTDGFTTHGVALVTTTQHVEAWWTVSEAVVQRADLGGLTT